MSTYGQVVRFPASSLKCDPHVGWTTFKAYKKKEKKANYRVPFISSKHANVMQHGASKNQLYWENICFSCSQNIYRQTEQTLHARHVLYHGGSLENRKVSRIYIKSLNKSWISYAKSSSDGKHFVTDLSGCCRGRGLLIVTRRGSH